MATRGDIWRKRAELRQWDMAERRRILEEHTKEFHKRQQALQAECLAAGGHFWEWKAVNPVGLDIHYCKACTATHIGELPETAPAIEATKNSACASGRPA